MLRDIHIHPVLNGYIVEVGCQTVVFTDPDNMVSELLHYLTSPDEVEKAYMQDALNAKHTVGPVLAMAREIERMAQQAQPQRTTMGVDFGHE